MADKPNIFNLNYDCTMKILSYLSIYDMMNLDVKISHFRKVTPYFYKRQSKLELDRFTFYKYPRWLWRKIGRTITQLRLRQCRNLNILLPFFPNVKELCLYHLNLDIGQQRVPLEVNRLKQLRLISVRIIKRSDWWFKQISFTLTEIVLLNIEANIPLCHLFAIKRASVVGCNISITEMAEFFENNRNNLESLELFANPIRFDDQLHTSLSMMPKITRLTFGIELQYWKLSQPFRQQIEYLNKFGSFNIRHPTSGEIILASPLKSLVISHLSISDVLSLVESIPTLQKVQLITTICYDQNIVSEGIEWLKMYLHSQQRNFTLVLRDHEVN